MALAFLLNQLFEDFTYTKTPKSSTRMPISKTSSRTFFLRSGGDTFMVLVIIRQIKTKTARKGRSVSGHFVNPPSQSERFPEAVLPNADNHACRALPSPLGHLKQSSPFIFRLRLSPAALRLLLSPRAVVFIATLWLTAAPLPSESLLPPLHQLLKLG